MTRHCHWKSIGWICCLLAVSGPMIADELPSLPKPLSPPKNSLQNASTAAKVTLGRKLFFDKRLSSDNRISCATCHDPAKGFSNGKNVAKGVSGKKGSRNVPTLFNVAYHSSFFWDGRASTLEEQALQPIQNPVEMNMPLPSLEKKLNRLKSYRKQFAEVFGGKVTAKRVAQAIAAYERTIISRNTPFDRFLRGDKKSLSPAAARGMRLFYGQARCFVCHKGPNLTDNGFHNVGVPSSDPGRRNVTGRKEDQGKFKTPTLREIATTAPYMHNGHFKTLKEVVKHYNFGGVTDAPNDYRDELLEVLYLGEDQVDDLVTFLKEGLTSKKKQER